MTASDWDAGDNGQVYYSIPGNVGELFHVDQHGVISVHAPVDREAYDTFRFPVLAVDAGSPPLTGSVQGGYIFYAGASLAGVSCRRRWPRLLLLS